MFADELIHFKCDFVAWSYAGRLQRKVLRKAWRLNKQQSVQKQCRVLVQRYRKLLDAISITWRVGQDPRRQLGLSNCTPTYFVPISEQRRYCCRYRQICPWCYTRWVRETWELFVAQLFPDKTFRHSPYSVVYAEPDLQLLNSGPPVANWLKLAPQNFRILPIADCIGHQAWLQLLPAKDDLIVARRKFLGLTTNHTPLSGKLVQPTRAQLAQFFAEIFEYPVELRKGHPATVAALLNLQHGKRLCCRYGLLRKPKTKRKA